MSGFLPVGIAVRQLEAHDVEGYGTDAITTSKDFVAVPPAFNRTPLPLPNNLTWIRPMADTMSPTGPVARLQFTLVVSKRSFSACS